MRWLLFPLLAVVACPTTTTAVGVPVVPDAVVDVAFSELAAFADTVSRLSRAGVLPEELRVVSLSALEASGVGAPIDVALREGGDVVVVARLLDPIRWQAAIAQALPKDFHIERRFKQVDAVVDDAGSVAALIRAGDGVVVVVGAPVDAWGAATLIEALGSATLGVERRTPTQTEIASGRALRQQVGGLEKLSGTLHVDGDDLRLALEVHTSGALQQLASGLSSSSPPFSCLVEDGAALALRLPPLGASALAGLVDDAGHLDGFEGRVLIALHEAPSGTPVLADDKATWASIVVAGRPRAGGAAGLKATLAEAGGSPASRTVGARQVQDLRVPERPWRQVSAVVDDDVFALSVGAPLVVDRVAVGSACTDVPGRLLLVDGPRLLRIAGRAAPELAMLRALGVESVTPGLLRVLGAVQRLEVTAVGRGADATNSEIVDVGVGLRLLRR
ncbi:MAG: hypothetical protein Q8O67_02170 [Deltaproteobacteria bacterium]|nr:hypothetical protein [Deltaproteobacteria bacterium]